jgi:hypothetical protein
MAHCKNCGRGHALQNATEFGVAPNGAPTVLRCKLCSTERRAKPEQRAHADVERDDHDSDMVTMEPITLEKARAQAALLQAEMRLM